MKLWNRKERPETADVFDEAMQLMYDDNLDVFKDLLNGKSVKLKRLKYEDLRDDAGNSLLNLACFWGKADFTKYLLTKKKFDPEVKNELGFSALDIAVQWGRTSCAELLLQAKGEFGIVGQLNKLKDRISVLEREKAQLIVERDEEIVKKIDLKVKLDVKIGELKVSRKQHQEALQEIERLKPIIANLKGTLKDAKKKIKELEEFMARLRESNYRLKKEGLQLKEKCKETAITNSELRVTIITLNNWIKSLRKSAQFLSLERLLLQEREKESRLQKEISERKARRKIAAAEATAAKLENIEKRCDFLEKKLAKRDTTCALDALNRLVPPSVARDAMKGLQSIGNVHREELQLLNAATNGGGAADAEDSGHFSRALGGATVPFDMLMVAPKGKGLSVARVLKCERDEMGQEERLTVRYRTNTWNILEPKAKKERRQLAFSEFLEVNEALGSVVVRRHIPDSLDSDELLEGIEQMEDFWAEGGMLPNLNPFSPVKRSTGQQDAGQKARVRPKSSTGFRRRKK